MVTFPGPLSIVPHCVVVLCDDRDITVFSSLLICETLYISAFLPVSRYIGVSGVCSFNLATRFHLQVYLHTSKGECQSIYHHIIIAIVQGHWKLLTNIESKTLSRMTILRQWTMDPSPTLPMQTGRRVHSL